jgi:CheY-like chemotaxis protein
MPAPMIVVVNHDPTFLGMMAALLTLAGWESLCLHATDNDVFARLADAQPALAVIDIPIHHRDAAWELLERIYHDPATAHVPVIVCTADVGYARE